MATGNDNAFGPAPTPAIRLANRSALLVFTRVVYAIIMREVRTRFGHGNLGYVRALLEPVLFMGGFVVIWLVLGRASPIAVPVEMFFLCSLFPFSAFIRTWEYTSSSIRANSGLLLFPIVRPLDFFIARMILEGASQIFVFVILATIFQGLFGEVRHLPADPLSVLLAAVSIILLGAGMGLVTGCLSMEYPSIDMVFGLVRRLMFFTSGVFFTADSLPNLLKTYLWWNPVLHATEWFRSSYFSEEQSDFLDLNYLWATIVAVLAIGLVLERRIYRKGY
jgi:capsular polysaccharide transport system permease protein